MSGAVTLKNSIEGLYDQIRETIKKIEQFEVKKPSTTEGFYQLVDSTERFLEATTNGLYDTIYQTTNLVEDHIRSVYLFTDDATLEGHATDLETHLAQMRMVGEGIKNYPVDFNDEVGDLINKYLATVDSIVKIDEMAKKGGLEPFETAIHRNNAQNILLINGGYLKIFLTIKDLKESCIRLMSILAMTLGRWETKLEDRVDSENLTDGLVMSNIEKGVNISSKKNKKKKKDNIYL